MIIVINKLHDIIYTYIPIYIPFVSYLLGPDRNDDLSGEA